MAKEEPIDLYPLEAELQAQLNRRDRGRLEALLDPSFREIGSSGVVYSREQTILALLSEAPIDRQIEMSDKRSMRVSKDVVLLTYRAVTLDPGRAETTCSLRSSIWRWSDGAWSIVFHQGTVSE